MIAWDRSCKTRSYIKKDRESRGSLTKVLGLFLPDDQHRKLRQKQRGGLTQRNIFSLCLLDFPYSVLLRSTGGRKGGARGGGAFDGAQRETEWQRAAEHSICGNMMEATVVSKDTWWVCEGSVIMWLVENTVQELYSVAVVTVMEGGGVGGRKSGSQSRKNRCLTD